METKKEMIIRMGRKNGMPTKLIADLLKRLRDQEQEITDQVYEFFRGHLKDDERLKATARHHYNSYLAANGGFGSFENWYEKCIYNMASDGWKEGVEDWLGQLKHNDELDRYLEDIKFNEFINSMDGPIRVHLQYSSGEYPGTDWTSMIAPTVHIYAEIMNVK